MGLDAVWQQCYQLWVWLRYEVGIHPIMFLGAVIVIVATVVMYKTEVRGK
jgi:hypothetical protein